MTHPGGGRGLEIEESGGGKKRQVLHLDVRQSLNSLCWPAAGREKPCLVCGIHRDMVAVIDIVFAFSLVLNIDEHCLREVGASCFVFATCEKAPSFTHVRADVLLA